jgi:phosphoribosylanthranilate isomerase
MRPHQIKICGLTTPEAVTTCAATECGFAGFIAYPFSPRHLTPEGMAELTALLPAATRSVLVTVNANDDWLEYYINTATPSILQLHGEESPERCLALKNRFQLPLIKAFGIEKREDLDTIPAYALAVDMVLLDTKLPSGASGGTGKAFDWLLLENFAPSLPWFLSGGIGVHNLTQALSTNAPLLDVSSLLESSKGIKDIAKIRDFMKQIDGV